MPKPEWGVKRSCLSCGARFYDLMRNPVVCPGCGAEVDVTAVAKPKRVRPGLSDKSMTKKVTIEDDDDLIEDDDEDEVDEDDDDEASIDETPLVIPTDDEDDEEVEEDDDDETEVEVEDDSDLGEFDDDVLLEEEDDDLEDVPTDDIAKL